jgi:hypothetical protein
MQGDAIAPRKPRRFLLIVTLLLLAFAGGFFPQWLAARRLNETLTATAMELRLATLHRELGVASHEVQRNNFASAGEAAARFFEDCTKLASTEPFSDDARTRVALLGYAAQRDEVMALIAAGDPVARDRLSSLYLTMNGVLLRRQQ